MNPKIDKRTSDEHAMDAPTEDVNALNDLIPDEHVADDPTPNNITTDITRVE